MVTGTHMDVRKAYDTVWRDGLMYKLWDKGMRGRMWSYIDALYGYIAGRLGKCGWGLPCPMR
jgi:hypothetical protein